MNIKSNPYKKTLLFITGWGFKSSIWYPLQERLKDNFHIINFNWYEVNHTQHKFIFQDFSSHFDRFTTKENILIIGWSLGGLIAYHHFSKILSPAKLICICSNPKFISDNSHPGIPTKKAYAFYKLVRSNLKEALFTFALWALFPYHQKQWRTYVNKHLLLSNTYKIVLLDALEFLFETDLRNICTTSSIPSLHVLGKQDALTPYTLAKYLKTNPRASVCVLKQAGHIPFLTHTHSLKNLIDKFSQNNYETKIF